MIEKILTKINSNKIDFLRLKDNLISKLELIDDYIYSYINTKISNNVNFKLTLMKPDFFE
ncbi:MAG: hypothetical protein Q8S84_07950 [bacterium]|nr:hypothetical protein [bacterium]MDP3381370.1 hypothetical protein [bacterium]